MTILIFRTSELKTIFYPPLAYLGVEFVDRLLRRFLGVGAFAWESMQRREG
nr:hypothetical protein [Methylocapsa sp. RX1]